MARAPNIGKDILKLNIIMNIGSIDKVLLHRDGCL